MLVDLSRIRNILGSTLGGAGGGSTPFVTGAIFFIDKTTADLGVVSLYACTDTSAPRTLTIQSADIALGSPGAPWFFEVKDWSGGAGTNAITIATEGAEAIDGAASVQLTEDYASVQLYSDGTNLYSR